MTAYEKGVLTGVALVFAACFVAAVVILTAQLVGG